MKNNETVVVTGGAGFIGSHLCKYLLEKNYKVICIDNLVTGTLKNLESIKSGDFIFINHDITEYIEIKDNLSIIFHLASPASPVDYLQLPIQTLKVGALGTHNILGLSKSKRAIMLLASTSEVYGDPVEHPQSEEYWGNVNPVGPRGVYDEAKRFAEAMAMAYYRQQGVMTRIARIFNTYGPYMRMRDGRVVPNFIMQCLLGKEITIYGNGSQTRSFCYIDDIVEGLYRLTQCDYPMPVNLGNAQEISILEFANKVKEITRSKGKIVFRPLPEDDPKKRMPDIKKAKTILNWKPRVGLEEGLTKTISWFKNNL
ncbi:MAG: SDR family oxidoreductase [Actinobacteria bacterium]|nr:SDR family oxidoreductase [Actinomycetota bacterium]